MYVLLSERRATTYVGISTDVQRRLQQHNGLSPGGARSTTGGRPRILGATYGPYPSRSQAQAVEYQVKRRRGRDRLAWSDCEDP